MSKDRRVFYQNTLLVESSNQALCVCVCTSWLAALNTEMISTPSLFMLVHKLALFHAIHLPCVEIVLKESTCMNRFRWMFCQKTQLVQRLIEFSTSLSLDRTPPS